MGLEYIQLYAMNSTFNLANISKVQWNTLKETYLLMRFKSVISN